MVETAVKGESGWADGILPFFVGEKVPQQIFCSYPNTHESCAA